MVGHPFGGGDPISFDQPIHADRMVKLDMPELDLDPAQPRRIEIHDPSTDTWDAFELERFSVDGRVRIRHALQHTNVEWVDLAKKRYRWVY